jgi:hypothetical protein
MAGKIIEQAARMIRAGNAFSESNIKLRNASWEIIEFLASQISEQLQEKLWEETGWKFWRLTNSQCQVMILRTNKTTCEVTSNTERDEVLAIIEFCHEFTGAMGLQLCEWLERNTTHNEDLLASVARLCQKLTKAQSTTFPQKDKIFLITSNREGDLKQYRYDGDAVISAVSNIWSFRNREFDEFVLSCPTGESRCYARFNFAIHREK